MGSTLAIWLQWVQALALVALPIMGAWIAWQQVVIARGKLRLDLFDRRFAVLRAVRTALGDLIAQANLTMEQERAFTLGTFDASFLFDEEMAAYLRDMRSHIVKLQMFNAMLDGPDHQKAVKGKYEELQWFSDQIDGLQARFAPFLKLRG